MRLYVIKRTLLCLGTTIFLTLLTTGFSKTPAYADTSVSGSDGTISLSTSGSQSEQIPGGISTSSATQNRYYNGWPITQTITIYHVFVPYVALGSSSYTNEPCLSSRTTSTTSYWEAYQLQESGIETWQSLVETYPICEVRSQSTTGHVQVSPAQIVTTYWNQTVKNQLPVPQFSVPPGFALTGLNSYVSSNCVTSKTFYDQTPLGQATIHAIGELWVNWGDGSTWDGPYNSCGSKWPNGTISHVFEYSGVDTVTVKETWNATWLLGTSSGSLGGLFTAPPPKIIHVYSITSEIYD